MVLNKFRMGLLIAALALVLTPALSTAQTLYAAGGRAGKGSYLWRINPVNAQATAVAPIVAPMDENVIVGGMAFSSSGTLYVAHNTHWGSAQNAALYTVNLTTGAATLVGALENSVGDNIDSPQDMAFADGTLYVTSGNGGEGTTPQDLFTVNTTTGEVISMGSTDKCGNGMAYDSANDRMLISDECLDGDLEDIDLTDAGTEVVCDLDGNDQYAVSGLAFFGTRLLGVKHRWGGGDVTLFEIFVTETGCQTKDIGTLPSEIEAIAVKN